MSALHRHTSRKGTTLVELSIVMAMIAIIGTMVASFCALTSARARQINVNAQVREALSNVEQALDRWAGAHDASDITLAVSSDGKSLQTYRGDKTTPEDDPFSRAGIAADCVDYLTFEFADSAANPACVTVICTVHYTRPATGNTPATTQTLTLYKTFHAAKAKSF